MKIIRKRQEQPSVSLWSLEPGDVFYIVGADILYIKTDTRAPSELANGFSNIVVLATGFPTKTNLSTQVVKVDCELLCKY